MLQFLLLSLLNLYQVLLTSTLLLDSLLKVEVLSILDLSNHSHGLANRESVAADEACDSLSHIIDLGHFDEHGDVVEKSTVMRIIVPGDDWEAAFRLKHI